MFNEGVVGITLTVLFGIVSVVSLCCALMKKKYPKRMEFYVLDLVRIISPLVRKYDSIKILHNEKEANNISLLRGMFLCVGEEDISFIQENTSGGLQISLPLEYRWLEVHPQESSTGLLVTCSIDEQFPNILHLSSELFKRDEAFILDAYIEGEKANRLEPKEIKVYHRLSNTGSVGVTKIDMPYIQKSSRRLFELGWLCGLLVVLTCSVIYSAYFGRSIHFVDKQVNDVVYSASIVGANQVALSKGENGVIPWRNERLAIGEFVRKFDICSSYRQESIGYIVSMIIFPIFMVTVVISLTIIRITYTLRQRRVINTYTKISEDDIFRSKI